MCGGVHDVITGNKFHQNRLRGFRATGVQKSGVPSDLACRPYNSSALPCWLLSDAPSPPPQNCPLPWGIWTPSNTWFPRPTPVINPNDMSIGSAVFAALTSVTDQSREWVTQSDPGPKWPIQLLTHDPCDPWPMGHRGRHSMLVQALHRFIDYPALYLDIVYVHTPLSNCYIIAHVSKLHTQAPVNFL